ncbi:MAG: peptidoglycan-binding protein, partial [Clostridia bacterium]|nr:peptidoglycan-binding protein [Clostridia bacterium]
TGQDAAVYPYDTQTIDSVNLRKSASTSSTRLLTVPKGATVTVLSMTGDFLKVTYKKGSKTYTGYVMAKYVDVPAVYLGGKELAEDAEARRKYTSMSQGAAGERVSALQTALKELGFYTGSISGSYDAATVTAVKAMQKKNGLLQTGTASPELQQLIFEGKPLNSKGKKTEVAVLPPIDGVTMREGDTGYQVKELQEALKKLGYYTGTVSGSYDSATTKAVKAFQQAKGLTADGVAGQQVLTALDRALATPTPVTVSATPTPITADNVVVIHRGTRGLAVTRLQQRLVELGYYSVTPDGVYDTNDINAVRAFQKQNGLTVDGVAGLDTQLALYADSAIPAWATPTPKPTATPKPSATPAPSTSETLSIGSKGDSVNLLQARLTTLGYFTDTIDGRYGTMTASAVAAFQENNGLTADGIAGPKTLKKVYSNSAKSAPTPAPTAKPTATPKATAAVNTTATLRTGDTGSNVRALQQALIDLGYLSGAADGVFGPKTYLAVKEFQKANGLARDGVAGPATLSRLQALAGGSSSNTGTSSGVTGTDLKAPKASEVRFCDWYSETRALAKLMPDAIIYDYQTGLYYHVHLFSFGKHADAEPVTASDTAIMQQIMGAQNWEPHAVWVIFSDGKVYMASTHSYGHEVDNNSTNGLTGHICIHFPREMSAEEKETMPYALRHQNEILRGWEETQSLIR